MYIGIKITKEKWDLSDLTNDNVPLENYGQYRYRGKNHIPIFCSRCCRSYILRMRNNEKARGNPAKMCRVGECKRSLSFFAKRILKLFAWMTHYTCARYFLATVFVNPSNLYIIKSITEVWWNSYNNEKLNVNIISFFTSVW